MNENTLTNGQLAFLALANEYCQAIETAGESDRAEFVDQMLHLLPRLYISAYDLPEPLILDDEAYMPTALSEEYYDSVRRTLEMTMGEDDTYLEVFEEEMKFSDTPIAVSISESLADIFQVLYNLTDAVKDAPVDMIPSFLHTAKEDFRAYWSQILCNVLRAINSIMYKN